MSLVGFRSSNHPQQVDKRGATDRDNLGTDPKLYARVNERFHFTLDVCATQANAKARLYEVLPPSLLGTVRGDQHHEFLRGRQRFVLPGAESIGPNERPPFGCCLLTWTAGE